MPPRALKVLSIDSASLDFEPETCLESVAFYRARTDESFGSISFNFKSLSPKDEQKNFFSISNGFPVTLKKTKIDQNVDADRYFEVLKSF